LGPLAPQAIKVLWTPHVPLPNDVSYKKAQLLLQLLRASLHRRQQLNHSHLFELSLKGQLFAMKI